MKDNKIVENTIDNATDYMKNRSLEASELHNMISREEVEEAFHRLVGYNKDTGIWHFCFGEELTYDDVENDVILVANFIKSNPQHISKEAMSALNEMYAVLNDSNRWHKHKTIIIEALNHNVSDERVLSYFENGFRCDKQFMLGDSMKVEYHKCSNTYYLNSDNLSKDNVRLSKESVWKLINDWRIKNETL